MIRPESVTKGATFWLYCIYHSYLEVLGMVSCNFVCSSEQSRVC